MKSARAKQSNEYGEPKRRRIDNSATRQSNELCQQQSHQPTIGLLDLPTEMLNKVIGYVNIWHHDKIRAVSKRLRDVVDLNVKHEFRRALITYTRENPRSVRCASLKSILRATEVYVNAGFESSFCGCMVPMLRHCFRHPFTPTNYEITTFLLHFYDVVVNTIGDENSQQTRLLYNVTLIRYLKDFTKNTVAITFDMPNHLCVTVEIRGPWLGILWASKAKNVNQSMRRNSLLAILSELYIANRANQAFKRVWECKNELYIFGYHTGESRRCPSTIFMFRIYGSKKICSLFRLIFTQNVDEFVWPEKWLTDKFTISLDIVCKEATKWGCPKVVNL